MKKIGIIGAMALEIRLIKEHMLITGTENRAGFTFITGSLNGKLIVLTISGVGKVNAAMCTQIMIDDYNVDCIINTGIAGSMNKELRICDVIISDDVTYHDVRREQMRSCFPYREYFSANSKLINYAINACDIIKSDNWQYRVGRIVSGDGFITEYRRKKEIIQEFEPLCVEMEGAAVGHVAYANDIPFIIIRTISEHADRNSSMNYETFEKVSANITSGIVINMLKYMAEYD